MTYIPNFNHLAANLSQEIFNLIEELKDKGLVLTQHQLNLFIGGWLSNTNSTITKI